MTGALTFDAERRHMSGTTSSTSDCIGRDQRASACTFEDVPIAEVLAFDGDAPANLEGRCTDPWAELDEPDPVGNPEDFPSVSPSTPSCPPSIYALDDPLAADRETEVRRSKRSTCWCWGSEDLRLPTPTGPPFFLPSFTARITWQPYDPRDFDIPLSNGYQSQCDQDPESIYDERALEIRSAGLLAVVLMNQAIPDDELFNAIRNTFVDDVFSALEGHALRCP
jgi:hypothetical protein